MASKRRPKSTPKKLKQSRANRSLSRRATTWRPSQVTWCRPGRLSSKTPNTRQTAVSSQTAISPWVTTRWLKSNPRTTRASTTSSLRRTMTSRTGPRGLAKSTKFNKSPPKFYSPTGLTQIHAKFHIDMTTITCEKVILGCNSITCRITSLGTWIWRAKS